jgi:hypothetical protein
MNNNEPKIIISDVAMTDETAASCPAATSHTNGKVMSNNKMSNYTITNNKMSNDKMSSNKMSNNKMSNNKM